MKNYYEEIAYWYFRFNGFFLLHDYVTHPKDNTATYHADSDLLGIKTPYVKEMVGLVDANDLCNTLKKLVPELGKQTKTIGLICEVKGGENKTASINGQKLKACIKRLGLLDDSQLGNANSALSKSAQFAYQDIEIHKFLVSATKCNLPTWNEINVDIMRSFIVERILKYPDKVKGWNHYNSIAIQGLLHEARKKHNP